MKETGSERFPASAQVDLGAVSHNLRVLRERAAPAQVMAVVKANGYGHGRSEVALAAYAEGIRWFGVSQLEEALKLRDCFTQAGISASDARIFTWLAGPDADWQVALEAELQVSASSVRVLEGICAAAVDLGVVAPVHLKIDVGMSRAGATAMDFPDLLRAARQAVQDGTVRIVGIWSHMSEADDPYGTGGETTAKQVARFEEAVQMAAEAGIQPEIRHLSATSGTLWHPEAHFDMVRLGIGMYGLSPNPHQETSEQLGLRPALTLQAPLVLVKQLAAGETVSYGGTWETEQAHWVGLVPLGYADGIPRAASNLGPLTVLTDSGPVASRVVGRICMDQFVIDLGTGEQPAAKVGDLAILFGGDANVPLADEWADLTNTINYELVARLAPTIPRTYIPATRRNDVAD